MKRTHVILAAVLAACLLGGCTQHYINNGDKAMLKQQYADALKNYQKALDGKAELASDPAFSEKYYKARYLAPFQEGQALALRGQHEAAIAKFKQSLAVNANFTEAQNAMQASAIEAAKARVVSAIAQADKGNLDQAAADIRRALELNPAYEPAKEASDSLTGSGSQRLARANGLVQQARTAGAGRHWTQAIEALQAAVADCTNHLPARAELFQVRQRLQQAEQIASSGASLLQAKRLDEAITTLQQAIDAWPDNATAAGNLAQAKTLRGQSEQFYLQAADLAKQSKWDESLDAAGKALDIYPGHPDARALAQRVGGLAADALIGEGDALAARGQLDAAEAKYAKALQYAPDKAGAKQGLVRTLVTRAAEAERRGMWGSASLWYMDAIDISNDRGIAQRLAAARAKMIARVAFSMDVRASSRVRIADPRAFQASLAAAIAQNRPQFIGDPASGAPVIYTVLADAADFRSNVQLVRSENRVQRYKAVQDAPNPDIPALRDKIARQQRELNDLVRARADARRIDDKRREIDRLERDLSREPALVRREVMLDWPFTVHFHKKSAVATVAMSVQNAARQEMMQENIQRAAEFDDAAVEHPNPQVGVPEDPLAFPDDRDVCRTLLDALAGDVAAKAIAVATKARIDEVKAAADAYDRDGKASESVEAYMDLSLLLEAIDPKAAAQIIQQLRSQPDKRRQLYNLWIQPPPHAEVPPPPLGAGAGPAVIPAPVPAPAPAPPPAPVAAQLGQRAVVVTVSVQTPAEWTSDGTWSSLDVAKKDADDWQPKITIAGPADQLKALRDADVSAFVKLIDADKSADGWVTRRITVVLPKGLTLVGEEPKVSFKLQKRRAWSGL